MSWLITGTQKVPPTVWDPNFLNVSLLLHGDGTNGSTTITDSSPSPKTVTAFGNAQISTAQSKFGGASIAFDGNGDYLTLNSNASDFAFGTADFTVEFWLYMQVVPDSPTLKALIDFRPRSTTGQIAPTLYMNGSSIRFFVNGADRITSSTSVILSQTWQHIALSRASGTTKAFVAGTQVGSSYSDTNNYITSSGRPWIGVFSNESLLPIPTVDIASSPNGYIDDLRITKGVARYTANFTPPTAPFPDI
jgi:hypothetical protein